MSVHNFGVIVPTYNAGPLFVDWISALKQQTVASETVLLIDSLSSDDTINLAREAGYNFKIIPPGTFDHGGTRQTAFKLLKHMDILVYLTQDAFLADKDALRKLVNAFLDETIGAAYGRQLPRMDASPIEAHARIFNYPPESCIKSLEDSQLLGIKTCFVSNSFAAYRCTALSQVGGFPENNIVSEETYVAAKMLEAGWKIKYCADATVYHSHRYTIKEDFQRNFDVGVFHSRQPWIMDKFGQPEGEGKRFVLSELSYLYRENILLIPSAILRTIAKYIGFKLGLCEAYLPKKIKLWLSMQKHFWKK